MSNDEHKLVKTHNGYFREGDTVLAKREHSHQQGEIAKYICDMPRGGGYWCETVNGHQNIFVSIEIAPPSQQISRTIKELDKVKEYIANYLKRVEQREVERLEVKRLGGEHYDTPPPADKPRKMTLREEYGDLAKRTMELDEFILHDQDFKVKPEHERDTIHCQHEIMLDYLHVLRTRITRESK